MEIVMQLGHIFLGMEALKKLSNLPMEPKVAYKILKYIKLVQNEFEIIERQRVSLVHELTGTEPGSNATIELNTVEHLAYVTRFGQFLENESDLSKLDMPFDLLLESIKSPFTVNELSLLEVFFIN
jgi:hypothetical protein